MIKEVNYTTEIGRNKMKMKQIKSVSEFPLSWKGWESNIGNNQTPSPTKKATKNP